MSAASSAPADSSHARSWSRWRPAAIRIVQVLVGAGLVVWLLGSGQLDVRALAGAVDRWPWWLAANVSMGAALLATTLRWHLLLRVHPIQIRLRDTGSLVLMGWCFNQITPGATGGDVAKGLTLATEHRGQWPAALLSIVVDRALGVATLVVLVVVASVAFHETVQASPVLELFAGFAGLLLAGLLGTLTIALWLPRRFLPRDETLARVPGWPRLAPLREAARTYRRFPRPVLAAAGCGLALHLLNLATAVFLACALLGPDFPLRAMVTVVPMIHLAAGVPITPFGNAGVLEATYAELMLQIGITDGALLGLLHRSVSWTWALVGAAVFVLRRFGAEKGAAQSQVVAPDLSEEAAERGS